MRRPGRLASLLRRRWPWPPAWRVVAGRTFTAADRSELAALGRRGRVAFDRCTFAGVEPPRGRPGRGVHLIACLGLPADHAALVVARTARVVAELERELGARPSRAPETWITGRVR